MLGDDKIEIFFNSLDVLTHRERGRRDVYTFFNNSNYFVRPIYIQVLDFFNRNQKEKYATFFCISITWLSRAYRKRKSVVQGKSTSLCRSLSVALFCALWNITVVFYVIPLYSLFFSLWRIIIWKTSILNKKRILFRMFVSIKRVTPCYTSKNNRRII
jgi:hypothetical protein